MEYTWLSCYINHEGKIVPDDLLTEAVKLIAPFLSFEEAKRFPRPEYHTNNESFSIEILELPIGSSADYYSQAVLKWCPRGSASHNPLARVCVTQEETEEDVVIGYYRKYAITREMRQEQAYTSLVRLLESPEQMNLWIQENCSQGRVLPEWACKPQK